MQASTEEYIYITIMSGRNFTLARVEDLVPSVVYGSYFQVSFPQIQHKFYKHVNKWNVTTTNIKKQAI